MIKMMMIKSNADLTGAEMQGNEVDVANLSLRLQDLNTKEAELAGNLKQWREKNGQVVLLSFTWAPRTYSAAQCKIQMVSEQSNKKCGKVMEEARMRLEKAETELDALEESQVRERFLKL